MNYTNRDRLRVALLTGGQDATYAHGLARALAARGICVDVIGSDLIDAQFLHESASLRFLNLRGDQREDVPLSAKAWRLMRFYWRLAGYAIRSEAQVFHILWNDKIELIDRTFLMLLYRGCGRRIVLTAHNVNAARRDGRDSALNRATLQFQYDRADHIFVHTDRMRVELERDFTVRAAKISVIPFGINDELPKTTVSCEEARSRLGIAPEERIALIFGQIAPYKGVEYAVRAVPEIARRVAGFRLIIAGKVKRGHEDYWAGIESEIASSMARDRVTTRIEHVPDKDVELYFKAADVLAMPYIQIFQSGLPFLAYSFGLPVVSTDAGSLGDDVVEGCTGYVCRAGNSCDFARVLSAYFASELFASLPAARSAIRRFALDRYSWERVAAVTMNVYEDLTASAVR